MFTLNQIRQELSKRFNEEVDIEILEKNLHVWDLEPESKDQNADKVFDKSMLANIYTAFKLKKEGYADSLVSKFIKKTSMVKDMSISEIEKPIPKDYSHLFEDQEPKRITNNVTNISDKQPKKLAQPIEQAQEEGINPPTLVEEYPKRQQDIKEKDPGKNALVNTLTENISDSVSKQILSYFNSNEFLEPIKQSCILQRDNEILSKQVEELMKANADLEEKVFNLELRNSCFKKIWGDLFIYLK